MNVEQIVRSVFDKNTVSANIYIGSRFQCKTMIDRFHPEMLEHVNNIELFCDKDYNILSSQIGKYDIDNGLRIVDVIFPNLP